MDASSKGTLSNEWIIGVQVKIKTSLGEEFEGEIFSYDVVTNCVVLQQLSNAQSLLKKNFRIVKTNFIKEVIYIGKSNETQNLELPAVNISRIRNKASNALKTMKDEAARIGVGVSEEAQGIFNALSKTLPCVWKEDTIIILNEVTIKPPYKLENCSGDNPVTLERVKKVLEGERKRLTK